MTDDPEGHARRIRGLCREGGWSLARVTPDVDPDWATKRDALADAYMRRLDADWGEQAARFEPGRTFRINITSGLREVLNEATPSDDHPGADTDAVVTGVHQPVTMPSNGADTEPVAGPGVAAAALREVAIRLARMPEVERELQQKVERLRLEVSATAMKVAIKEALEANRRPRRPKWTPRQNGRCVRPKRGEPRSIQTPRVISQGKRTRRRSPGSRSSLPLNTSGSAT